MDDWATEFINELAELFDLTRKNLTVCVSFSPGTCYMQMIS